MVRFRQRSGQTRSEERAAKLGRSPAHDSVAERVELTLEQERVRLSLAVLTQRQSEAIRLAFYEDCSYAQVAERRGFPWARRRVGSATD